MADSTAGEVSDDASAEDLSSGSPIADGPISVGSGATGPGATESSATGPGATESSAAGSIPTRSNAGDLSGDTGRVARIVAALRNAHAEQAATAAAGSGAGSVVESTAGSVAGSGVPSPSSGMTAQMADTGTAEPVPAAADAGTPAGPGTETGALDAPALRRESTGVRPATPSTPTLRWNPGARYRASKLANGPAPHAPSHAPSGAGGAAASSSAPTPSVPAPPVPAPPVPAPPVARAPVAPAESGPPVPVPPVPAPPVPAPPVPAPPVPGAASQAPTQPPYVHAPVPPPPGLAGRLYRGPARRTAVFEREIWYPVARSSRVPRDVGEALVAAVERYRKGSISTSGLVRAIGKAHAA
jgi:hypothetical protein